MAIRAILFDLGDTLFRLHPLPEDFRPALAGVLRDVVAEADAVQLAGEIQDAIRDAWEASSGPGLTAEVDNAGTIADVLEGIDNADLPRLARRLADVFGKADVARFEAGEDCGDRVATFLNRGVRLGLVSNTSTRPDLLAGYMDQVGLTASLFQTMLFSSATGIRKPNPKVYERALRRMGTRPDETLFVGDRVGEDIRGPMAAGMYAVLTHEFRQEDPGSARPIAVVRELLDVHEVLRTLRT